MTQTPNAPPDVSRLLPHPAHLPKTRRCAFGALSRIETLLQRLNADLKMIQHQHDDNSHSRRELTGRLLQATKRRIEEARVKTDARQALQEGARFLLILRREVAQHEAMELFSADIPPSDADVLAALRNITSLLPQRSPALLAPTTESSAGTPHAHAGYREVGLSQAHLLTDSVLRLPRRDELREDADAFDSLLCDEDLSRCRLCGEGFKNEDDLLRHIAEHLETWFLTDRETASLPLLSSLKLRAEMM